MARRGSAAMRATSFLWNLPGRAASLLVPALFAGMVQAGGLDEVAADVDPCPTVVRVEDASMTADMLRQWGAVRRMSCPDLVPVFIDRATGVPLSEEEKLRRIFNGGRIPAPVDTAVIPTPGAMGSLLAGLALLGVLAARRRG